jgi:MFS family permease
MPFIMFIWGIFTIAHAWTKSYAMLVAFRLMIGLFEAGFFPTACFYLSTFYTRSDLALRIGLFYGMYAVAGAFSGAISYGVFHIQGNLRGWQWLFIIGKAIPCK